MPTSGQLPWKLLYTESGLDLDEGLPEQKEQAPINATVQLVQRNLNGTEPARRRASVRTDMKEEADHSSVDEAETPSTEPTEDVASMLSRLEKDLKAKLEEMDKKLDGLSALNKRKSDQEFDFSSFSRPPGFHAKRPQVERPPSGFLAPAAVGRPSLGRSRTADLSRAADFTRTLSKSSTPGTLNHSGRTGSKSSCVGPGLREAANGHEDSTFCDLAVAPMRSYGRCETVPAGSVGQATRARFTKRCGSLPHSGEANLEALRQRQSVMSVMSEANQAVIPPRSPANNLAEDAVPPSGMPAWLALEAGRSDLAPHEQRVVGSLETNTDQRRASSVSVASTTSHAKAVANLAGAGMARRGSGSSSASIGDMIRAKIWTVHVRRSQCCQNIWQFLEEPESSRYAFWFSRIMQVLVVLNVLFSVLQSQQDPMLEGVVPGLLQIVFDLVCTLEVMMRFFVCPNRLAFFGSLFNWVDLISGAMIILRVASLLVPKGEDGGSAIHDVLHCIVPVIWLLKLLRSFEKFHLLCSAFIMAFEALPVLLFTLTIIVLSFSAMIYFVEPRDNIEALPRAIWFTIVTMMTVGYGDVVPHTSAGNLVISCLIIGSQLYMAIPLGIVGGSFSRVWEDRDRLLLMRRTKTRLLQWGYTPRDILELFHIYDQNRNGELDVHDFSRMMREMRLGLDQERIHSLFKSFDADGSGKVDHEEFLNALYPNSGLYDNEGSDEDGDPTENAQPSQHALPPGSCLSMRRPR